MTEQMTVGQIAPVTARGEMFALEQGAEPSFDPSPNRNRMRVGRGWRK